VRFERSRFNEASTSSSLRDLSYCSSQLRPRLPFGNNHWRRFDVLSWLVLGGLEGLRPYEVLRLERTGIHFQTREIRVEPGWTKTHRARVVPLQPNALEWLKLVAAHTAIDGDVGGKRKIRCCLSPGGSAKMTFYAILTASIGRLSFEIRTTWPKKWATP